MMVSKPLILIAHFIVAASLSTLISLLMLTSGSESSSAEPYKPTWESLDARPLPKWYDEDKFGIFIHWGVFSVPAMGEWFWYNWKEYKDPKAVEYMKRNQKPDFSYQDFARDFTAENFNATQWASLFAASGARYVVLTSKHHEGYALWPSTFSFSWNSVDVGPHRNIVDELATAIRNRTNLKFGLYHSRYEWFNPLYLDDKKSNFTKSRFVDYKTGAELYELVEEFKPEIIWSDGEWEAPDTYWKSKEFLAWLYNDSPVKETVVVNDRWGSETLCKHGGFLTCKDRYTPGHLLPRKWENCMTIDKKSWGYRKHANIEDYYTSHELIKILVETVALGGNLLLNVGPTHTGDISPIFQERLHDIGKWLSVNEEGIYGTNPWTTCQNDTENGNIWYTTKKYGTQEQVLFAIFLQWPETGILKMKCVTSLQSTTVIRLLGIDANLKWHSTESSTEVVLPNKAKTEDCLLESSKGMVKNEVARKL
ncbi:hypothetical protein V9T40_003141 [Parthenolecanium corni]|uniref:Putative alpha-L-fucosidase n=1 Tax=Parthenolecanium corni TaxID=536013 RepID=A0AAN9TQQ3_9HEMI